MPNKPLEEKDFIQEEYSQYPFRFWIWIFIVTAFTAMSWFTLNWFNNQLANQYSHSPFLQVTNRQMSLFLWQNSSYMRVNATNKNGYLPGFQYIDKIGLDTMYADDYVICPPEVLFLYHTWDRLISTEFPRRPIPVNEFKQFLAYSEEWLPANWPSAPKAYVQFIQNLPNESVQNLSAIPDDILPSIVKLAFVGWKNYFKEGNEINAVKPTYGQMAAFLAKFPHYAHNYWRNIVDHKFLQTLFKGQYDSQAIIPNDELAPFLKVAFYNYLQSAKNK